MPWDTGGNFLSGLNQSLTSDREYKRRLQEQQDARENAVFTALANSDDPDVRAAAVTGLLSGKPPGKFMDRFMGKMQEHPAYEQIRGLVAQGKQPYPGATEGARRASEAQTSGSTTGIVRGLHTELPKAGFTPDEEKATIRARLGGNTGINKLQPGTLFKADGTVWGSVNHNQMTGEYTDSGGNVIDATGMRFSPSGSIGSATANDPEKIIWDPGIQADTGQFGIRSPGGWHVGHKLDGTRVHTPAHESESITMTQTDQGLVGSSNRRGADGNPQLAWPTFGNQPQPSTTPAPGQPLPTPTGPPPAVPSDLDVGAPGAIPAATGAPAPGADAGAPGAAPGAAPAAGGAPVATAAPTTDPTRLRAAGAPAQDASRLRAIHNEILDKVKRRGMEPHPIAPGLAIRPEKQVAYTKALDAETAAYGIPGVTTFKQLTAMMGGQAPKVAGGLTGAATGAPPVPPPAAGANPRSAPGGTAAGSGTPGGQPASQAASGGAGTIPPGTTGPTAGTTPAPGTAAGPGTPDNDPMKIRDFLPH